MRGLRAAARISAAASTAASRATAFPSTVGAAILFSSWFMNFDLEMGHAFRVLTTLLSSTVTSRSSQRHPQKGQTTSA